MKQTYPKIHLSVSSVSEISPSPVSATRSCCRQAISDALEANASMGSIASLALLMMGFAMGFGASWWLFG